MDVGVCWMSAAFSRIRVQTRVRPMALHVRIHVVLRGQWISVVGRVAITKQHIMAFDAIRCFGRMQLLGLPLAHAGQLSGPILVKS